MKNCMFIIRKDNWFLFIFKKNLKKMTNITK